MTTIENSKVAAKAPKRKQRDAHLVRSEFKKLTDMVSEAILQAGWFKPEEDKPKDLRAKYSGLYSFMKKHCEAIFEHEFDIFLMFGIKLHTIDLVNGTIEMSFDYESNQSVCQYKIKFYNHLAPYSEVWPNALAKQGLAGTEKEYKLV